MARLLFAQVVQLFRGKKNTIDVETKPLVICKNCAYQECDGRDGMIVCDITGDSHPPDWYCAAGEPLETEV